MHKSTKANFVTELDVKSTQITENEFDQIEKVIERAAQIEKKELNRINKLYQRYSSFNKPLGNGDTECLICKSNFGLLNVNPIICNSCLKVFNLFYFLKN